MSESAAVNNKYVKITAGRIIVEHSKILNNLNNFLNNRIRYITTYEECRKTNHRELEKAFSHVFQWSKFCCAVIIKLRLSSLWEINYKSCSIIHVKPFTSER
ncbi:MAG: hypothetical protein WCC17_12600 [Candidatus Nitrosopolaris sp.]